MLLYTVFEFLRIVFFGECSRFLEILEIKKTYANSRVEELDSDLFPIVHRTDVLPYFIFLIFLYVSLSLSLSLSLSSRSVWLSLKKKDIFFVIGRFL